MSARKERRMSAVLKPLTEQVQEFVSQENTTKALGIVDKYKLKASVHMDKAKKEVQIIYTIVQKATTGKVTAPAA